MQSFKVWVKRVYLQHFLRLEILPKFLTFDFFVHEGDVFSNGTQGYSCSSNLSPNVFHHYRCSSFRNNDNDRDWLQLLLFDKSDLIDDDFVFFCLNQSCNSNTCVFYYQYLPSTSVSTSNMFMFMIELYYNRFVCFVPDTEFQWRDNAQETR